MKQFIRSKLNIISMALGVILVSIAVYIGSLNDFQGGNGSSFLIIGTAIFAVGFAFTPKIHELTMFLIDMVVMFFNKP